MLNRTNATSRHVALPQCSVGRTRPERTRPCLSQTVRQGRRTLAEHSTSRRSRNTAQMQFVCLCVCLARARRASGCGHSGRGNPSGQMLCASRRASCSHGVNSTYRLRCQRPSMRWTFRRGASSLTRAPVLTSGDLSTHTGYYEDASTLTRAPADSKAADAINRCRAQNARLCAKAGEICGLPDGVVW